MQVPSACALARRRVDWNNSWTSGVLSRSEANRSVWGRGPTVTRRRQIEMNRWFGLILLSLAIGGGLAWLARPLDVSVRWGEETEQSATLSLNETTAEADWTPAEEEAIEKMRATSRAFVAIAREVSPAVVTVYSERVITSNEEGGDANPFGGMLPDDLFHRFFRMPDQIPRRGMGSGVIISPDGLILTNNHVVTKADRVKITLSDGRTFDAEVRGVDPKSDVAVVQVDGEDLPVAPLGSSADLEVGEWVIAIGNPFQLNQTVTAGIVSAKGRSSVGLADYEDFIQTDAAINPGNSGGALVNLRGEVVGINTAIATRSGGYQGIGFAIPIDMAESIMSSLLEHGRVVRGYLGVTIQNVDAGLAEAFGLDRPRGALVNSVQSGTAAEDAGVETGDVILEVDGHPVENRDDLRLQISGTPPDTPVELTVLRDGRERRIRVELGELPSDEELASIPETESGETSLEDLGFSVEGLSRALVQRFELDPTLEGVLVTNVDLASPASDAGLREGDIIVEAGRDPVANVADLRRMINDVDAGRTLLLKVHRNEANIFLALRIPNS
ncbi:MAG: Do family serine endopeptidase [Candidatus Eisenbacteria bacterium]|nr:Do family serine endopeptidase [Candidatus Latescibacterota bacterium]MBD3303203.1 Do family serine endopeptidase [Candidatus Eisenbacteria bacterium]